MHVLFSLYIYIFVKGGIGLHVLKRKKVQENKNKEKNS